MDPDASYYAVAACRSTVQLQPSPGGALRDATTQVSAPRSLRSHESPSKLVLTAWYSHILPVDIGPTVDHGLRHGGQAARLGWCPEN